MQIGNRKSEIRSRGQAMVEFMVGLVVALVLLAGLIQIGKMAHIHTRTMITARAQAGQLALAANFQSEISPLISDWSPGPDQRRYTRDDVVLSSTNTSTLPVTIGGSAQLDSVSNGATMRTEIYNTTGGFFLVKGEASESVPILSIIQRLVYPHPTLEVESDAWLVWTEGIY